MSKYYTRSPAKASDLIKKPMKPYNPNLRKEDSHSILPPVLLMHSLRGITSKEMTVICTLLLLSNVIPVVSECVLPETNYPERICEVTRSEQNPKTGHCFFNIQCKGTDKSLLDTQVETTGKNPADLVYHLDCNGQPYFRCEDGSAIVTNPSI